MHISNTKITFRSWDEYDLSEDAQIDKYALDVEAEKQAHLMCKWIELLSAAQGELSKTKEVLNDTEARLFLKAKTDGIPSLGGKPTEATVKAWVHTQPEYRKAQRQKRKADDAVHYLQNARSVLEHRKTCLKIEADLWICGYYARPSIYKEIKEDINKEKKKEHSIKLKKSMRKRHLRQDSSITS